MILRTIFIAAGLALIAAVVYLGYLTASSQALVPWFGVASALLAPSGFALIGSALSSADKLAIRRLSKVPEIEQLIEEASTQEEKLKALQAERADFLKVVEYEAQTRALKTRRSNLESDAARILSELDSTEAELAALNKEVAATNLSTEAEKLRERVGAQQRGDVVVRLLGTDIVFPRAVITMLPFSGYFEVIEALITAAKRMRRSKRSGA